VGELKPTKVTLQLADKSVKVPLGEIVDVLIKVGEFIFPVDSVILEIVPVENPRGQILLILGEDEGSDIKYTDQESDFDEVKSWFDEINQHVSQVHYNGGNRILSQVVQCLYPDLVYLMKNHLS